jgi:hypothetical protein
MMPEGKRLHSPIVGAMTNGPRVVNYGIYGKQPAAAYV